MPRRFCVVVESTLTYRRKVWVEVEETTGRLADEAAGKRYSPTVFSDEAQDAAVQKARMLTGWEPYGEPEYRAVSVQPVGATKNVDVAV